MNDKGILYLGDITTPNFFEIWTEDDPTTLEYFSSFRKGYTYGIEISQPAKRRYTMLIYKRLKTMMVTSYERQGIKIYHER